jgi:hypothetical protein
VDLFVSYAGPDRPWAEWAAWQLQAVGYTVELDVWDWSAGDNATLRMNDALARAKRVLVLYSPAYFDRDRFTTDEWTAVMGQRPNTDGQRRLIPVRVTPVDPPPILTPLVYRDLFGLEPRQARVELLTAVRGSVHPSQEPAYPIRPARGSENPRNRQEMRLTARAEVNCGRPGLSRRYGTCLGVITLSPGKCQINGGSDLVS